MNPTETEYVPVRPVCLTEAQPCASTDSMPENLRDRYDAESLAQASSFCATSASLTGSGGLAILLLEAKLLRDGLDQSECSGGLSGWELDNQWIERLTSADRQIVHCDARRLMMLLRVPDANFAERLGLEIWSDVNANLEAAEEVTDARGASGACVFVSGPRAMACRFASDSHRLRGIRVTARRTR